MKLLGSTKSKITKDANGENVLNLEIAEQKRYRCNEIINQMEKSRKNLLKKKQNYTVT